MAENTFLGLQPYTEADAYRFKGRTEESQELFRLIVRNDYTVCYAESGEGKTSLLNAGVFPLLRQNMYFPIAIMFTSDDYQRTPDDFDTIIDRCIKDSIADYNEKNQGINIEYKLYSSDFQDTDRQSVLQQELSKYSWWKLRNYKPQAMGLAFTPVFVFDQFEEVFNLPGSIVWTKKFFDWLEEVSSDSCPDEIAKKVRDIIGFNAAFPAIKEEKDFKAVFSLRKEFIGELDYWGMQKCFIPSLKNNRYCLKALTYEGARKVMTQQQRFDDTRVKQVLEYFVKQYSREPEKTIAENLPVIPALLISVVCDSWEKDIDFFSRKGENEIGQSVNMILERFYEEALSSITNELSLQDGNSQAVSIRKDIDTAIFALIDGNGKRVRRKSSELSHLEFDAKYKETLSECRIIKITKVDGEDYVEIIHDALCSIIAKRKEQKLVEDAKKREKQRLHDQAHKMRKRMTIMLAIVLISICIIGIVSYQVYKINEANQSIIESNWKIMENRARFVGEKASPLIDYNGDSYLASLIAIDILPSNLNSPDKPYVPEAESILRRASLSQNAKLVGHTYAVISASFSPDGKNVVSFSLDNSIRIWDAQTGKCEKILKGHKDVVHYAEYSFDGKDIVSASQDSTIRIWDAKTGKTKQIINGEFKFHYAAFNRQHTQIVCYTVSDNLESTIRLWDIKNSSWLWQKKGKSINRISFNPEGTLLISYSKNLIQIWDAQKGRIIKSLRGHQGLVSSASFDDSGKEIVSSSWEDKFIRLWDVNTGKCLKTINSFENGVSYASFSKDGKSIFASSEDSIGIWNRNDGTCNELTSSLGTVCRSFSPDGKFGVGIPSGYSKNFAHSDFKEIYLISFHKKGTIKELESSFTRVVFSPNSQLMLKWFSSGIHYKTSCILDFSLVDINNDSILIKRDYYSNYFTSYMNISPQGTFVYGFNHNNKESKERINLWNIQTGDSISFPSRFDICAARCFSSDENFLLTVSEKSDSLAVWDLRANRQKLKIKCGTALFSPQGHQIASISGDSILLWNLDQGKCSHIIVGNGKPFCSVCFSPDGLLLASIDFNNAITLWDTSTGNHITELAGYPESEYSIVFPLKISFSPNGNFIFAYSHYLCTWDISNYYNREKSILPKHIRPIDNATINNVSFNYDGTQLMANLSNNYAIIYDIASGINLLSLSGDQSQKASGFLPDGKQFYFQTNTTMLIAPWPPLQQLIDETRERFKNRQLTPEERRKYYLE